MRVHVEQGRSRRGRTTALTALVVVLLAAGLLHDRDDETNDFPPLWRGVVHVDGEPVAAELLPKGDWALPYGYKLCATPPGAPNARCVEVTDSNDIDARLEPTSRLNLLIVLSGSDRPLDLDDGAELPFGPRGINGALVAVDMVGDCVSFAVPDPTGGTSQTMRVQRTVYDAEDQELVEWSLATSSAVPNEDGESCHRLN